LPHLSHPFSSSSSCYNLLLSKVSSKMWKSFRENFAFQSLKKNFPVLSWENFAFFLKKRWLVSGHGYCSANYFPRMYLYLMAELVYRNIFKGQRNLTFLKLTHYCWKVRCLKISVKFYKHSTKYFDFNQ